MILSCTVRVIMAKTFDMKTFQSNFTLHNTIELALEKHVVVMSPRFQRVFPTDHGYCRYGSSNSFFLSKSDFHGNSDFHNSHQLDPLQITAKINFRPKYASLSKIFCCKKSTHGALQKQNKIHLCYLVCLIVHVLFD